MMMSDYKFGTWYPIDGAPTSKDWILVADKNGHIHIAIWGRHPLDVSDEMDMCWTTGYLEVNPTHWMPMPQGPVEELLLFDDAGTVNTSIKAKDHPGFDSFWHWYPKKEGKKPAIKTWNKEKPDLDAVRKTLEWQIKSEQWRKGYIPLPTTYLNQRRYEDEQPEAEKLQQVYQ